MRFAAGPHPGGMEARPARPIHAPPRLYHHPLQDCDVGFRSVQESIGTTTPGGKLVFHIFAALAEYERDLIRELTKAGLTAAAPGNAGPGQAHAKEIAAAIGVGRSTLYPHLPSARSVRMPRATRNSVGVRNGTSGRHCTGLSRETLPTVCVLVSRSADTVMANNAPARQEVVAFNRLIYDLL